MCCWRSCEGDSVGGNPAMIEPDHLAAGYEELAITPALSGVNSEPGSMTAIVGLNAAVTPLKTLAGFIPPVSGRLTVSRPVIGWLAQRAMPSNRSFR